MDATVKQQRKTAVATLSIVSNTVLVVLKLVVGLSIGAVSIISEALHSAVDLLAAIIAFLAVRVSGREADEDHPFGHGKYENISGAIEALLIFVAAAWIISEAVHKLMKPTPLEAVDWGMVVMFISAVANIIVSGRLFKVAKETDSLALSADAWHLRTDVYTSVGVMVGLALIWIGKRLWPAANLDWVDPVAAILVAGLIIKAAWDLTAESVRGLLDTGLDQEDLDRIHVLMVGFKPRVCGYHHLHTRKGGATRFIEMHLIVEPYLSVSEAHTLTDEIGDRLRAEFSEAHIIIHPEPCEAKCKPHCRAGCLVPERQAAPAKVGS